MEDTRWKELCEAIIREKDPRKLIMLVEQLNEHLEQREEQLRLRQRQLPSDPERPDKASADFS